ncbi:MAG TPA: secretin N-terminal domain-containing protein [Opitutaceae bacterium]|nr:secretin N-terminal domain-containing protein [Opitutaceae bacterium]
MKPRPSLILAGLLAAGAAGAAAQPPPVSALPAAVPSAAFSFRAENVPIKEALALFARANRLVIVPDLDVEGNVTVDFQGLPLDLAMSALLDANGYYCVQDGALLRVRKQEQRLFQIDYIRVTRSSQGSNAVQISSSTASGGGGSGGATTAAGATEGSEMTVTNAATVNFWGDLGDQLKSMISPAGSFTINSLAGTVMVKDSHRNVQAIAEFLGAVTKNIVRQIDLDVEIYEVALNNSHELGINWQNVAGSLSLSTIPGSLGIAGSGLIVQNPVYGPGPPPTGVQAAFARNGLSAVLDALSQQGTLKVVSKPRLRTLNNQPAVVRVGQDIPIFSTQVTQSPGSPPVITTNETVQTITVGTVLSITPQVSADGNITLDVTPAVSRLVSTETSASGNTSAPVIDIRQASSLVRIHDGATVILGGLVEDSAYTTHRTVPILGSIPVLGKAFSGDFKTSERTELIFFLTPHLIPDAGAVASADVALPPAR